MEFGDRVAPTEAHVVEILRGLVLHELLHGDDQLLALQALLEQVVYGHKDLSVLGGPLHLLGGDVLVLCHHAVLGILELLQLLLPLRDLVVKLDLLCDSPLSRVIDLLGELLQLLVELILLLLQFNV